MNNNTKTKSVREDVTNLSLKNIFNICISKWWWFAICLVCAIGIALFYIYYKQPEYKRYEQVLVNDTDSDTGISGISNAFSSLGLFSKNTNVYNEMLTMTSPAILYQVADSLQLDINYYEKDGLRKKTLYGTNLPFRVKMLDIDRQGSASFRIRLEENGEIELFKFVRFTPDGKVKYKGKISGTSLFGEFNTPIGKVQITPNPVYKPTTDNEAKVYQISKMPLQTTVELYGLKLNGDLADQDADVIELTIEDVSVQRAVDILNYVLIVYNQNWLDDKNKIATTTSKFIDERLKVIQSELTDVDQNIAEYMKNTGTFDVSTSTSTALEFSSKMGEALIADNNQLAITQYMKDFLKEHNDITTVLPINLGIASQDLTQQIAAYNDLLINRNTIVASSSDSNPIAESYAIQLKQLRAAIDQTIDNRIAGLETSIENTQKEIDKNYSEMSNLPEIGLPLLQEERQQQVKQALYLFLLQKKEENELTQKFSTDNLKIITPPVGPLLPVAPRIPLIIIVAVILGIGIPFVVIFYLETSDTTIRKIQDLESLEIPINGEINQVGNSSGVKLFRNSKKQSTQENMPVQVVEAGQNNVTNESFRVLRGSIDFMNGSDKLHKVIMITSLNKGSGKSFVALNLALTYAMKNQKVLIIDCDLRNNALSRFAGEPSTGLMDYLSGKSLNPDNLVVHSNLNPDIDILSSGAVSANGIELLEDKRMLELINRLKEEYDEVILDCSAAKNAIDTQILSQWSDCTVFVVRAGQFEKSSLKDLNKLYKENKYKNMSVILNGTQSEK